MTLKDLEDLKEEDVVEVNGVQLSFQVSMLSNGKFEKEQEKCLLESYYEFLDQSKQNGFISEYIEMTVNRALCIFKNVDGLSAQCFRSVSRIE